MVFASRFRPYCRINSSARLDALPVGAQTSALMCCRENAREQLRSISGHCVRFLTGLCLFNAASGHKQLDCVRVDVYFRVLSGQQIDRYLEAEQPYQCAGSFKSEALGISLIEKLDGPDPTALIGLPLIRLTAMLQNENYNIP